MPKKQSVQSCICNDSNYYYVVVNHRVCYKTNAIRELYDFVMKLRKEGKSYIIA